MKVLYCNPVFFEYRLPFYKELLRLFKGNFYVMYSPMRMRICGKEAFPDKIKEELGENALPLFSDHVFDTYSKGFDRMPDIERGKRIPFTFGLMRAIHKVKPDVLITEGYFQWTPLVILYASIFRIPLYMGYERTPHTERNASLLKTLHRKLTNKFISGFLVNGSETKKYLMSIGVEECRIFIGGMSADSIDLKKKLQKFKESESIYHDFKNQIININGQFEQPKGLTYLFSGRISILKGVDHLLKAWEKHQLQYSNDHLILIGHGDKYDEYSNKYKTNPSIHLIGKVDYNKIHKYYAIADIFILPTLTDNWSLVIPEAMACGLPVATSIYNGCHTELVKEGKNGTTFDTFDQDSIIRALDYFHHQNLAEMGKCSIELEKEFDTEHCAYRVYKALTNPKE